MTETAKTPSLDAALAYCTELVRLVFEGAPIDTKENGDKVLRSCGGHTIDDLDAMAKLVLFGDEPWAPYFKGERNDETATRMFDAVAKAVDPSVENVPAWWEARIKALGGAQ